MQRYRARHKKYDYFAGGKRHGSKYNSNPIYTWLISSFMDSLLYFVKIAGIKKVFEIGCGEGQLIGMLCDKGYDVAGMDYDGEAVQLTMENFEKSHLGGVA